MLSCKISSKMSAKTNSYHQRPINNILMLSIIWIMLFTETWARPNLEALLNNKAINEEQQQRDFILNEIMTNANNDKLYNKLKKYHHNQPNYPNKWPNLRDLVLDLDYDQQNNYEESNEFLNSKFFERLQQLATSKSESYDEDMLRDDKADAKSLKTSNSLTTNPLSFKDHNIKKNAQYMSPCHFKICNMGRKRNARLLANYY